MSIASRSLYAVLSGLFASASSLFGKLAGVYYSDNSNVSFFSLNEVRLDTMYNRLLNTHRKKIILKF